MFDPMPVPKWVITVAKIIDKFSGDKKNESNAEKTKDSSEKASEKSEKESEVLNGISIDW